MLRTALFSTGLIAGTALASFAAVSGGYADPKLCAGCHAGIARNYARTGMARSFHSVDNRAPQPEFNGGSFFHSASRELFTLTMKDGAPYISRSQPGPRGAETNVFGERVDYVIGSGNHAISYLHRTRDNKLTEFPVSWYPESGGHWDMSPAYDRPDHPGFSRELSFGCIRCHNAYPVSTSNGDAAGETIFPAQLPEGIDCQRCHGPGQNHIDAASSGMPAGDIRAAIVNPSRLDPERQTEVCLQCHLETTSSRLPASLMQPGRGVFSWRPGEPLEDFMLAFDRAKGTAPDGPVELVSAPYRLAQSKCTPLTCTTCHDPHVALSREDSIHKTEKVCTSCHQTTSVSHPSRQDCVTCHMPQTAAADVIHAKITDHWISKPHAGSLPSAEINARNTPPYAGEVALYYSKKLTQSAGNAITLAIAQAQSNPVRASSGLDRLTAGYRPGSAASAAQIGQAFLSLMQPQKALAWYRQAFEKTDPNWMYLTGLGNAQQALGHPDLAADSFAKIVALAPWETDALFSLGQSYAKQGKLQDAVRTLREAVTRNPESAVAYNDLGSVLLKTSAIAEAEAALREAVRIQPEFASLRMNLADALIRQHKLSEAQEQLEEAIRIGGRGETAEAQWYATLLATGNPEQALKVWRASFVSQVAGAHINLGTIFASENKPDDAIREYRLAVEGDPLSYLAQFNLGLTLFSRGLNAEALPWLRKAAESPDPAMRATAQSLLERAR